MAAEGGTNSGGAQRWGRAPSSRADELTAGPVTVSLQGEDQDLRRIRAGRTELAQRVYFAVRDAAWGTIPPAVTEHEVVQGADAFRVRYSARFVRGEIDLSAVVTFEGLPDGTIRADLDGVANRDFAYNRIGFCVLHGLNCVGRPYRARTEDGQESQGSLPSLVGPQRMVDGTLQPLFPSYRRLEIDLPDGVHVRFNFEGDLFEMEDQRNWTDASFKTYSTPLALGVPHHAVAGARFRQRVEIDVSGVPARADVASSLPTLTLGDAIRTGLPSLGFGTSSMEGEPTEGAIELLRRLRPAHLRADVQLDDPAFPDSLRSAARSAARLGAELELALSLSDDATGELERLAPAIRGLPVRRFLVFRHGAPCSDGRLAEAVRTRLRAAHPDAEYAAGTDIYFSDLNRFRPDLAGADAVVFPIVPSVHATDDLSLLENLEAQVDVVRTAQAITDGLPVVISPVTLKPRFNPFASGEEQSDTGELPTAVDPRQATLFGAVWTLGSIKYLTEAGAGSVTYYETVGWRGLIESQTGSPLPDRFPSRPGMIFPLYWVFADLADWHDAEVLACTSSDPAAVIGLVVRRRDCARLLAGNLTGHVQRVAVRPSAGEMVVRYRDSVWLDAADSDRPDAVPSRVTDGELELGPYALACVDLNGV